MKTWKFWLFCINFKNMTFSLMTSFSIGICCCWILIMVSDDWHYSDNRINDVSYTYTVLTIFTRSEQVKYWYENTIVDAYLLSGYTGKDCLVDIDECFSNPCKNSGSCTELSINGYTCNCAPGWTGSSCEINMDNCVPNLCNSTHTQCIDLVDNFR